MSREVRREPFSIELRPEDVIRGDAWIPDSPEPGAAIVVCHGFKGFKDWGFFPHLAERLATGTGRVTVGFNFTGSGVGESLTEFEELEKFGHNTFTRELQDLEAVLDRIAGGRLGGVELPPIGRFALLGHSRGGATCVLKAANRTQVAALVTWASIAGVARYVTTYGEIWEAGESVVVPNARTGQDMPLHRNVLDDILGNPDRLDVLAAAATLSVPYLVVHGTDDESVAVDDAHELSSAADGVARLEIIDGAGHTFGAVHPFAGSNAHLDRAIDISIGHYRSALAE